MTYKEYKARRTKGSQLRGHHIPQQKRLNEKGIDPNTGTIVTIIHKKHVDTRTYGSKGGKVSKAETGMALSHSEKLDLQDKVVQELGKTVINPAASTHGAMAAYSNIPRSTSPATPLPETGWGM